MGSINWRSEIEIALKIETRSSLELKNHLSKSLGVKIKCPGPYYVALNSLILKSRIVKSNGKYALVVKHNTNHHTDKNDMVVSQDVHNKLGFNIKSKNGVPESLAIASYNCLAKLLNPRFQKKQPDVNFKKVDMETEENIAKSAYKARPQVYINTIKQKYSQPSLEEVFCILRPLNRTIDYKKLLEKSRKIAERIEHVFDTSDYIPAGNHLVRPTKETIYRFALMKAIRLDLEPQIHLQLTCSADINCTHKKFDYSTIRSWSKHALNRAISQYVKGYRDLRKNETTDGKCPVTGCDARNPYAGSRGKGAEIHWYKAHWCVVHFALYSSKCMHCGRIYHKKSATALLGRSSYKETRYWNRALQQAQHSIKFHLPEKLWPLQCKLCDRKFVKKSKAVYHIRNKHLSISLACPSCGACFSTMAQLMYHINYVEKSLKINIKKSNKAFTYKIVSSVAENLSIGSMVTDTWYQESDFAIKYDENTELFINENILKLY